MTERPAPSSPRPKEPGVNWDLASSVGFALLGLVICVHASGFPGATRGVPGPAFFPIVIGVLMIVLSAALLATTWKEPRHDYWARPGSGANPSTGSDAGHSPVLKQIGLVLLLLVIYVSLWTVVPFVVRTPLLLIAIYRLLGEPWPRTLLLAVLLTASLFAVFQGALSVQL
jgi:hypothetical protein